jgi:uncharacterized membrane protein YgcG
VSFAKVRALRAIIASILGVAAAVAPRPAACNTYVRDDLNLLRADTFAGIQRRNEDLIARTGACVDVITVAAAGNDAGKFALNTALAFGNHCSLGAAILITQTGTTIRFEDASAGINGSWQAISDNFGKGMATGDVNAAVMTTVNSIADGIIAHPPPPPPPRVYASPPPGVSALDTIFGVVAANWQSIGGRLAIIAACVLVIILGARAAGFGRSR